ncbi:DEAD/DEAH box helicase family protein [Alkalibacillus sp. S2W]|uniref:DEAD/DEAH box helicase family protein n=1 Tax=Alkalibacillus sp. S2W TaxID=3386553 RepID=UPI00398CC31D
MTTLSKENQDVNITVIDSIMGSGKTSYAIQRMNDSLPLEKFIYITPYLEQVERIKKYVPNRTFYDPTTNNEEGSKLRSLKQLIIRGECIVSTHELFKMADEELLELLDGANYTLILDEVMDVVQPADVSKRDIKLLLESNKITVQENRVVWNDDEYSVNDRFYDIKMLADNGNLFYHRGQFLVWAFPAEVFKAFDEVMVLTYLFHAQLQRYYFDLFNFNYSYNAVELIDQGIYELVEYDKTNEGRQALYDLINVHDGPLNDDDRLNAYSSTYLRNMDAERAEQVQKNIFNFFRSYSKEDGKKPTNKEIMWTTLKGPNDSVKKSLSGKGYTKRFAPLNIRATNDYRNARAVAYVYNRYMNPIERTFFEDNGVKVDEDLLAVSDLLQYIFRSRIREENPESIDLYLPSKRMRTLLEKWANYEI